MSTEETVESPFAVTPEGREWARRINAEQLADLEQEQAALKQMRDHLAGETPIGEALSYFYGQYELDSNVHTWRELKAAKAVAMDLFKDRKRYRDSWAREHLASDIEKAIFHSSEPGERRPDTFVKAWMLGAIDAHFKSEQGLA